MYRPPGLTKAQWESLLAALRTSHGYTVTAEIHDLDDEPFMRLPPILDGQVDGTLLGRSLTVTFGDPGRAMHPIEGAQAAKYIIRVTYVVEVDGLDDPVEIPVFTGPIDTCVRADAVVTITARGKSTLLQKEPGDDAFSIAAGVKKTEAMMRIGEAAGELRSHMNIPDKAAVLGKAYPVGALQSYWHRLTDLGDSLDLLSYYDAAGFLTARPHPTTSSFTFRTGEHGFLTKMPNVTADVADFHNEVWFYYTTLKQKPPPVKLPAPPEHPLSAQTLKWRDSPRRKILKVTREHVKTQATALVQAQAILDRELLHTVTVQAECFPFPFVEQGDLYRFNSTDYTDMTGLDSWTLPLVPGTAMTLGWSDVRNRGVGVQ